jgi:hypothetical protein
MGAMGPRVETSETVEERAADEMRRHCELLVEDMEMAKCEQTMALAEAEGASVARRSEDGGPSGFEPARSRVRAEVFCQWPARFVSAGVSACQATDHARAGQGPGVREQRKFNP